MEDLQYHENPFTWSFHDEIRGPPYIIEKLKQEIIDNDDQYEQSDFECITEIIALYLALSYEYCLVGNHNESLEVLNKAHDFLDKSIKGTSKEKMYHALLHIIVTSRIYINVKNKAENILPDDIKILKITEMDKHNQAALSGMRALFYGLYGPKGNDLGLKHASNALEIDKDESLWYFLKGKYLSRIRRAEKPDDPATEEEIMLLEKAMQMDKNAAFVIFTAQTYRETAKCIFKKCRINFPNGIPQEMIDHIDKLNALSSKLYHEAYKFEPKRVKMMFRCAKGFIILPVKYQDLKLAEEVLIAALKLRPDSGYGNHTMAQLYEKKNNIPSAIKHLQICKNNHNFEASMDLLRLQYKQTSDDSKLLSNLQEYITFFCDEADSRKVTIYCQIISIYILKMDDIEKAVELMKSVIIIDPNSEHLKKLTPLWTCKYQKINLYELLIDEILIYKKANKCSAVLNKKMNDLLEDLNGKGIFDGNHTIKYLKKNILYLETETTSTFNYRKKIDDESNTRGRYRCNDMTNECANKIKSTNWRRNYDDNKNSFNSHSQRNQRGEKKPYPKNKNQSSDTPTHKLTTPVNEKKKFNRNVQELKYEKVYHNRKSVSSENLSKYNNKNINVRNQSNFRSNKERTDGFIQREKNVNNDNIDDKKLPIIVDDKNSKTDACELSNDKKDEILHLKKNDTNTSATISGSIEHEQNAIISSANSSQQRVEHDIKEIGDKCQNINLNNTKDIVETNLKEKEIINDKNSKPNSDVIIDSIKKKENEKLDSDKVNTLGKEVKKNHKNEDKPKPNSSSNSYKYVRDKEHDHIHIGSKHENLIQSISSSRNNKYEEPSPYGKYGQKYNRNSRFEDSNESVGLKVHKQSKFESHISKNKQRKSSIDKGENKRGGKYDRYSQFEDSNDSGDFYKYSKLESRNINNKNHGEHSVNKKYHILQSGDSTQSDDSEVDRHSVSTSVNKLKHKKKNEGPSDKNQYRGECRNYNDRECGNRHQKSKKYDKVDEKFKANTALVRNKKSKYLDSDSDNEIDFQTQRARQHNKHENNDRDIGYSDRNNKISDFDSSRNNHLRSKKRDKYVYEYDDSEQCYRGSSSNKGRKSDFCNYKLEKDKIKERRNMSSSSDSSDFERSSYRSTISYIEKTGKHKKQYGNEHKNQHPSRQLQRNNVYSDTNSESDCSVRSRSNVDKKVYREKKRKSQRKYDDDYPQY